MKTTISHKRSRRATEGAGRIGRPGLIKRITAAVLMLLLSGVAALVLSTPAKAADNQADYSFYKLSSSLAAFFSNARSPDDQTKPVDGRVWNSVLTQPGSAGSMLGYLDPSISDTLQFLNSQISGSSSAVGYDTLVRSNQNGGDSTETPGMLDYAHFGATLNAMGLDSMSTGLSLNFLPAVGGCLVMLLYILTGVVDLAFAGLISTLKLINPFTLFYEGVKAVSPEFAEGMTGGQASSGFLGGLSSWIGQWYKVLNNLSWAVLVPLFIGVLLLGLLLHKNMNRGSAIRKLLIRVVFIGVGLPLVGSMYTGVLNSMGDATKSGSAGSTQVVLSTYVDFQNWALKKRLAIPANAVIEWDATGHKPTAKALANVRNSALEINKSTNTAWAGINSTLNVAAGKSWTAAAMEDTQGAAAGGPDGYLGTVVGGTNGDGSGGLGGYMGTIDLLARYMSGTKVEAASFETAAKGDISTSWPLNRDADGKKQVSDWFTTFSDPLKGIPAIKTPEVVSGNPVLRVADGAGLTATPAGKNSGEKTFTSPKHEDCNAWVSNSMGEPRICNMSPLSLYNYLNTSFNTDSMTMYSSNKATSGATREMHSAVTQVGTGTMSGLYWLNTMVLLASFVIIGLGYAFSVLFANIKRSFQLMTAIPFATIGALPGIAKVIIYATAMVLEVIVTLFIYRFVQVFLISIPQIVEIPFSAVLNTSSAGGGDTTTNLLSGGTLPMVMTVLSIISLLIFTVLALRTRKSLVKAINEAVTKLVDKFMETNVAPPGGKGGLMPALAGGMASGAGMAAANKIMTGSPNGGKKAAGPGNGPASVTTGGVPPVGGPGGPQAGGPAGELPAGGGAGPDGSGGAPGGNGNPGSPLALGPGPSADGSGGIGGAGSSDQSTAKAVVAQGGLSEPGHQAGGGITNPMAAPAGQVEAQPGSTASGAKAAVKGVEAAGRAAAGDVPGAAAAGISAAGHARNARKQSGTPPQGTRPRQAPSRPAQAPKTGPSSAPKQAPRQAPKQASAAPTKPVPSPAPKPAPAAAPVKEVQPPRMKPAPRVIPAQGPANRPQGSAPRSAPRPVRKDGDA